MTSLPEIGHLLQSGLVTWIIWETLKVWVMPKIRPDLAVIPVTALASVVYLLVPYTPWAHDVLSMVALVALLHYLLSAYSSPPRK